MQFFKIEIAGEEGKKTQEAVEEEERKQKRIPKTRSSKNPKQEEENMEIDSDDIGEFDDKQDEEYLPSEGEDEDENEEELPSQWN